MYWTKTRLHFTRIDNKSSSLHIAHKDRSLDIISFVEHPQFVIDDTKNHDNDDNRSEENAKKENENNEINHNNWIKKDSKNNNNKTIITDNLHSVASTKILFITFWLFIFVGE